jgi:triacylglycerol lipase
MLPKNFDAIDPGTEVKLFRLIAKLPPFRPANVAQYDAVNCLWLLRLSHLCYRRDDHGAPLRTSFYPEGCKEEFFDRGSSQAALIDFRDFYVLAFRGTEMRQLLQDVLVDLRAVPAPWKPRGQVHSGFRDAFDTVWPTIAPKLRALTKPLFITGHSLGGALATLATAACRAAGIKVAATYTFGAPRVGDGEFTKLLAGQPFYRVVNDKDLVATVPLALTYRHFGTLVHIANDGAVTITKNAPDGPRLQIRKGLSLAAGLIKLIPSDALQEALQQARNEDLYDHAAASYDDLLRRHV